jgi:hypothetical protein
MLALLLLARWWCLICFYVWLELVEQQWLFYCSSCACVLAVLWDLPCEAAVDEWSRVHCWKGFYVISLFFSGRQQGLAACWWLTSCVCVVCCMHTAVWAAWLCVCANSWYLACVLAVRWSARQSWSISTQFHYSSNLPCGFTTWRNFSFVVFMYSDNLWLHWSWRSSS